MTSDLREFATYEAAVQGFRWSIPSPFNVAVDVCDRHAASDRVAAISVGAETITGITFAELAEDSNRFADRLIQLGICRGDRVGMILRNGVETLVVFLGIVKAGAVAVTMRWHTDPDLYEHEIGLANLRALVVDPEVGSRLPSMNTDATLVIRCAIGDWERWRSGESTDAAFGEDIGFALAHGSPTFKAAETHADDPFLINFTSGSTGPSKGAVQPHRIGRASLPAFQMASNLGPAEGDLLLSNMGWSTMGGIRAILLPGWYFGCTVVALEEPDPSIERLCAALEAFEVNIAYLMPAVLRGIHERRDVVEGHDWSALRTVITSGEPLRLDVQNGLERELGVIVQSYYGQTEIAAFASPCRRWFPRQPGSIGRAVPGHTIQLDSPVEVDGERAGTICLAWSDPGTFLGYVGPAQSLATSDRYCTGDVVRQTTAGDLYFIGRDSDVIRAPDGTMVPASDFESVIQGLDGVQECCAVQLRAGPLAGEIGISIQSNLGGEDAWELLERSEQELRKSTRLPVIPRILAVTRFLPQTISTQKVNRVAVRASLERDDQSQFKAFRVDPQRQ